MGCGESSSVAPLTEDGQIDLTQEIKRYENMLKSQELLVESYKNELNKITKELSTLKLKAKLKQATKSKNVKGKPGMKKSGKPKQNARNSKDKKGNGNSKSTNANKK